MGSTKAYIPFELMIEASQMRRYHNKLKAEARLYQGIVTVCDGVVGVTSANREGHATNLKLAAKSKREVRYIEALDGRVNGVVVQPALAILNNLLARSPEGTCPG